MREGTCEVQRANQWLITKLDGLLIDNDIEKWFRSKRIILRTLIGIFIVFKLLWWIFILVAKNFKFDLPLVNSKVTSSGE